MPRLSTLLVLAKYVLIPHHRYQLYVYVYDNFVEIVLHFFEFVLMCVYCSDTKNTLRNENRTEEKSNYSKCNGFAKLILVSNATNWYSSPSVKLNGIITSLLEAFHYH